MAARASPLGLPMYVPLVEDFVSVFNPTLKQPDVPEHEAKVFICGRNILQKCKRSSITELIASDLGSDMPKDNLGETVADPSRSPVWVDIEGYTHDDLESLSKRFHFHPLTTEDIFEESQHQEKVEVFPNYTFFLLKEIYFHADTHEVVANYVKIVLFKNLLISFHSKRVECVLDALYRVYKHSTRTQENTLTSADWPLYAILDNMANLLRAHVDHVESEADILEEVVLLSSSANMQADLLKRIGRVRRELTTYSAQLVTKKALLNKLIETKHHKALPYTNTEHMAFFRDVLDEVLGLEERLALAKETVNNLHATHLARISIETAVASNAVNDVMKKFSAVATVFIPLGWLAGLWGMNVRVPGDLDDNYYWFFGIISVCAMWGVIAISLLWKKGWL